MVPKRLVILGVLALCVGAALSGTIWNLRGNDLQGQLTVGASQIIDDGDAGFTASGKGWQTYQHALGYKGDLLSPTSITDTTLAATWTFSNITAGQYKFYVTFKAYNLLTNQAPYVIKDGTSVVGSTTVNQKVDPSGNAYDGKNWILLGTYTVKGPAVSITLSRPQDLTANGVIADAARIELVTLTASSPLRNAAAPASASKNGTVATNSNTQLPNYHPCRLPQTFWNDGVCVDCSIYPSNQNRNGMSTQQLCTSCLQGGGYWEGNHCNYYNCSDGQIPCYGRGICADDEDACCSPGVWSGERCMTNPCDSNHLWDAGLKQCIEPLPVTSTADVIDNTDTGFTGDLTQQQSNAAAVNGEYAWDWSTASHSATWNFKASGVFDVYVTWPVVQGSCLPSVTYRAAFRPLALMVDGSFGLKDYSEGPPAVTVSQCVTPTGGAMDGKQWLYLGRVWKNEQYGDGIIQVSLTSNTTGLTTSAKKVVADAARLVKISDLDPVAPAGTTLLDDSDVGFVPPFLPGPGNQGSSRSYDERIAYMPERWPDRQAVNRTADSTALHGSYYEVENYCSYYEQNPKMMPGWRLPVEPNHLYRIFTTYPVLSTPSSGTTARYMINNNPSLTASVDQHSAPNDGEFDGKQWKSLGTFISQTNPLFISICPTTSNRLESANADAVRIEDVTDQQPPEDSVIVDDADAGFKTVDCTWTTVAATQQIIGGSYRLTQAKTCLTQGTQPYARWTTALTPGTYNVYLTYSPSSQNAKQVAYRIMDGSVLMQTVNIDQTKPLSGISIQGTDWRRILQSLKVTHSTTKVEIMSAGTGVVNADAVLFEKVQTSSSSSSIRSSSASSVSSAWTSCSTGYYCTVAWGNNQCNSNGGAQDPTKYRFECSGTCGNQNCNGDCCRYVPLSSSSSSLRSSSSSSVSSASSAWTACPNGNMCTATQAGDQCAILSMECPLGTHLQCDSSCGNTACAGQCCKCVALSSSSSSAGTGGNSWIQVGPPHTAWNTCATECAARGKTCAETGCTPFTSWNGISHSGGEKLVANGSPYSYTCANAWGAVFDTYQNYCCCTGGSGISSVSSVSSSSSASSVSSLSATCTDSDGNDYRTAGTVQVGNVTYADSCTVCNSINGMTCYSVKEMTCNGSQVASEEKDCSAVQQGFLCKNGRCVASCGDTIHDPGEECDGTPSSVCETGEICTNLCRCASPLPGSVSWQTVGNSYLVSTLSDYALFGYESSLYLVGGKDFWGPTNSELRSTDGLTWTNVASLPEPLSNAASTQTEGKALLLGGLKTNDSATTSAFETNDLTSTGFHSNTSLTLPVARYDGAVLRVGIRTYFLSGYSKSSSLGASLLSSLLASLFGEATVDSPSLEIYVHNGTSWTKLPDLPFDVTENGAFALGNKLFMLDHSFPRKVFESADGTAWTQVSTLPAATANTTLMKPVLHKGAIWLIGTTGSFAGSAVVTTDGQTWTAVPGTFPSDLTGFSAESAVSFKDDVWVLGTVSDLYTGGSNRTGKVLKSGVSIGQICGNGTFENTEQCDDNNTVNGDGCSSSCQIESGWVCNGQPSVCDTWIACADGFSCPASPFFGNGSWQCGRFGGLEPGCTTETNGQTCGNASWCPNVTCIKTVCGSSSSSQRSVNCNPCTVGGGCQACASSSRLCAVFNSIWDNSSSYECLISPLTGYSVCSCPSSSSSSASSVPSSTLKTDLGISTITVTRKDTSPKTLDFTLTVTNIGSKPFPANSASFDVYCENTSGVDLEGSGIISAAIPANGGTAAGSLTQKWKLEFEGTIAQTVLFDHSCLFSIKLPNGEQDVNMSNNSVYTQLRSAPGWATLDYPTLVENPPSTPATVTVNSNADTTREFLVRNTTGNTVAEHILRNITVKVIPGSPAALLTPATSDCLKMNDGSLKCSIATINPQDVEYLRYLVRAPAGTPCNTVLHVYEMIGSSYPATQALMLDRPFVYSCSSSSGFRSSSSSSSSLACAGEGQRVYSSPVFGPTVCCNKNSGIKPSSVLAGDMCISTSDGSLGTCVNNWWLTCGNGTCNTGEDRCNCLRDCPAASSSSSTAACITESHEGHSIPMPGDQCCQGLRTISTLSVAENGSCIGRNDGSFYCSALCGNGHCEGVENKCNCPQDCPVTSSSASSVTCITEGNFTASGKACCAGLNALPNLSPYSNGTCPDVTVATVCVRRCGDGSCTTGENKCNCPEDCPAVICPALTPPLCTNGVLVPQLGPNANGCPMPPVCCNGATSLQAQCAMDLQCGNGTCLISSCTCQ